MKLDLERDLSEQEAALQKVTLLRIQTHFD